MQPVTVIRYVSRTRQLAELIVGLVLLIKHSFGFGIGYAPIRPSRRARRFFARTDRRKSPRYQAQMLRR